MNFLFPPFFPLVLSDEFALSQFSSPLWCGVGYDLFFHCISVVPRTKKYLAPSFVPSAQGTLLSGSYILYIFRLVFFPPLTMYRAVLQFLTGVLWLPPFPSRSTFPPSVFLLLRLNTRFFSVGCPVLIFDFFPPPPRCLLHARLPKKEPPFFFIFLLL